VTSVHPEGRFGEMKIEDGKVLEFSEKRARTEGVINGGFMVLNKSFVSRFIDPEQDDFLEREPMRKAVAAGEMSSFEHDGFWQCMDTLREFQLLNEMWASGKAPWTKYW
jgi:glucose-1-phosphate cytidylyltransferase